MATSFWYLSPSGDKLLYITGTGLLVRFLTTNQDITIGDCPWFRWLDNETVYCFDYKGSRDIPDSVISHISGPADAFQKIPVKALVADQVELDTLLKQAKAIYSLQLSYPQTEPASLLILGVTSPANALQYYHLTGIENLDEVLKNYHYTSVLLLDAENELLKKRYSPNKAYYALFRGGLYSPSKAYYYLPQDSFGIYDATNDQLLAEVKLSTDREYFFLIGGSQPNQSEGWAADSSGIYFQIYYHIGLGPRPPVWPIQKLCVPGKC